MEDTEKRLLLAIVLSALVVLAWSLLFPPSQRPTAPVESKPAQVTEGQLEPEPQPEPEPEPPADEDETSAAAETEAAGPAVEATEEQTVLIDNGVFEVELTNRGARAKSWRLLLPRDGEVERLELWPPREGADNRPLDVELGSQRLNADLNTALFRLEHEWLEQEGIETVVFTWADGRGLEARKTLTFRQDDYLVDVELDVRQGGRRLPARLSLGPGFTAESTAARTNYYYGSQALWNVDGQVHRTAATCGWLFFTTACKRWKDATKGSRLPADGGFVDEVRWAGLEDQFFTALVLPEDPTSQVSWTTVKLVPAGDVEDDAEPQPEPVLSVSIGEEGGRLYVGPKQYTLLRKLGSGLDKAVWFSSKPWLAWIVRRLYLGLVWLHDKVTGNYGLAIILATVVLRLLLFPINQFSMVSMKKSQLQMQKLQPKVKAIRNKYRKLKDAQSRAKMNEEMMALYRKEGVNPAGGLTGCLPLLAQFPILIGFYNMLTVAVELRGAPFFGWIRDLSDADPYKITPLLMGVTMFVQQKMAMSRIKDPQQLQQQRMMLFMPVMFTVICLGMPAGLVLYWFVNNLLGMGQQWLVNRQTSRLEA